MRQDIFGECDERIKTAFRDGSLLKKDALRLHDELAGKKTQQQKLDHEFALGKIESKIYNEWSWNIRRDVGRITKDLDDCVSRRKRKKENKYVRAILIILSIGVGVFAIYKIPAEIHARRTIAGIPEPVQIDIAELNEKETSKTIEGDGFVTNLVYLASYDIKGLVVELDDYDGMGASAYDRAIPRDLSLAWGKSAEFSNEIKWSHGNRKLKYEYEYNLWESRGLQERDFITSVSNNHLITDNKDIYRKIKRVRLGDYIEMKGYLVEGSVTDTESHYDWHFRSSLTRDDFSRSALDQKTSCEIFYVTSLEWLD